MLHVGSIFLRSLKKEYLYSTLSVSKLFRSVMAEGVDISANVTSNRDCSNCAICLENFDSPRNLQCGHMFCGTCLEEYISSIPDKRKVSCPVCRQNTELQPKNASESETRASSLPATQIPPNAVTEAELKDQGCEETVLSGTSDDWSSNVSPKKDIVLSNDDGTMVPVHSKEQVANFHQDDDLASTPSNPEFNKSTLSSTADGSRDVNDTRVTKAAAEEWFDSQQTFTCDICDPGIRASHYCIECDETFCGSCATSHRRMKVSRTHKVTEIDADCFTLNISARYCEKHPSEELDFLCKRCDSLICNVCIAKLHSNHFVSGVEEEASDIKECLENVLKKGITSKLLQAMKRNIQDAEETVQALNMDLSKEVRKVRDRGTKIHEEVDATVVNIERRLRNSYEKSIDNLIRKIASAREEYDCFEKTLNRTRILLQGDTKGASVIENGRPLLDRLQKCLDADIVPVKEVFQRDSFNPGPFDKKAIRGTVGSISSAKDVSPLKTSLSTQKTSEVIFKNFDKIVNIAPTGPERAWIRAEKQTKVHLVTTKGAILQSVSLETNFEGIASDTDGNCIAACPLDKSIKQVTPAGLVRSVLLNLAGHPRGVDHRISEGGQEEVIFTCSSAIKLSDEVTNDADLDNNVTKPSADNIAGTLHRADYPSGKNCVKLCSNFKEPSHLSVCRKSGNVVVADVEENKLIILNRNGEVIAVYGSASQTLLPVGVSFDVQGSVIYATENEKELQRITVDGIYCGQVSMSFSASGNCTCTSAVAVHEERVWYCRQEEERISWDNPPCFVKHAVCRTYKTNYT